MIDKLLGNLSKGLVFVLSAPAGTGKTTLVRMLRDEFPCVAESISCTTRPPRPGEIPGKDYHFLTVEEFEDKIKKEDFLEYAKVFDNYYGTSKEFVLAQQEKGKHVILVIDTQGAMQLKGKIPAVFVFVSPPSLQELRERLFKRQTESMEHIEQRLSWAKNEMSMAVHYDYHIVNENLHTAYEVLRSILIAEEHRTA
ncbi:MAG TPA: guanylate kinase [Rhabdochlamydiaceae bacterium]|nr:guanylate kinase [Rhabdochlamydiaceae bacterium]